MQFFQTHHLSPNENKRWEPSVRAKASLLRFLTIWWVTVYSFLPVLVPSAKYKNKNIVCSKILCRNSSSIESIHHQQLSYINLFTIRKPAVISSPPTTRRYHFDGSLKSKSFAKGNTLAYFAYSVRRSLWRSRLILGVNLRIPRKMKKDPSKMDKLLSTIFDILCCT